MKTTEILITQFKHINSNFKEYLKMAIPIIFGLFFISTIEQISTYLFNDIYSSSLSITINIIQILIIIYVSYYFFRNYINLHRFIILQDTSNYYSPLKKFKVTFKYILYFLLYILSAMLVLFLCIIMDYAFPNLIIFQFGVGWMLLFVCAFVYPFFGLALPQIAIGEKISLKKIFYESRVVKRLYFIKCLYFTYHYIF